MIVPISSGIRLRGSSVEGTHRFSTNPRDTNTNNSSNNNTIKNQEALLPNNNQ